MVIVLEPTHVQRLLNSFAAPSEAEIAKKGIHTYSTPKSSGNGFEEDSFCGFSRAEGNAADGLGIALVGTHNFATALGVNQTSFLAINGNSALLEQSQQRFFEGFHAGEWRLLVWWTCSFQEVSHEQCEQRKGLWEAIMITKQRFPSQYHHLLLAFSTSSAIDNAWT